MNQNNSLRYELKYNLLNELNKQQIQINKLKENYNKLKSKRFLTYDDINSLERIVEAEAGNQDLRGKTLVACVVLNRLNRDINKDKTVYEVITKPGQFQPVRNGKYYSVIPSEETKEAVSKAIYKDYSNGALFFRNPEISSRSSDRWFGQLKIVKKHLSHVFYKTKE